MQKELLPIPQNIDEYIAGFPVEVEVLLKKVRRTIQQAVPDAEEAISYKMPTFNFKGKYLIYFSANQKHIGLYPAPIGVADFKNEEILYGSGKGTFRFPLDKPIPFDVIVKVVKYRAQEIIEKAKKKKH